MRGVKQALKHLGNPDASLSEKDQLASTKSCLLKIGNHIGELLALYKEPERIKEWRSYLWVFVSKFTEFDANRLHKLYKHMLKKLEDEKEQKERDKKVKNSPKSSLHYGDKPHAGSNQASSYNRKSGHTKSGGEQSRHSKKKDGSSVPGVPSKFTPGGVLNNRLLEQSNKRPRDERGGDLSLSKSTEDFKRDRLDLLSFVLS